jgi:HNH endonuclease
MRMWNRALRTHIEYPDEEFRAELKRYLHYNKTTGAWYWKQKYKKAKRGDRADRAASYGYFVLYFRGKRHQVSTLAYFYMTGKWPEKLVDHRNLIRSDNRWVNLRSATYRQNAANHPLHKNNTSGLKGASWSRCNKLWIATIRRQGKTAVLGYFDCRPAAHFAYLVAADIEYGEFARVR